MSSSEHAWLMCAWDTSLLGGGVLEVLIFRRLLECLEPFTRQEGKFVVAPYLLPAWLRKALAVTFLVDV